MVRATTLKKNAKARAASMNSDKDDAIMATIILPPGHEHVLEDLKKVMTDSIMLDRRPDSEGPKKKEKAVNPFNIAFIANSVAEAFIDCVYEGDLEDAQAMWYLELMRGMLKLGMAAEMQEIFDLQDAIKANHGEIAWLLDGEDPKPVKKEAIRNADDDRGPKAEKAGSYGFAGPVS